jgi:hypothetical protein
MTVHSQRQRHLTGGVDFIAPRTVVILSMQQHMPHGTVCQVARMARYVLLSIVAEPVARACAQSSSMAYVRANST